MHRISRSWTSPGLTLTSTVTSSPTCKSKSVSLFPLNAVATRTLCSALAIFCFARFFSFIRILRTRSLWNTKVTDLIYVFCAQQSPTIHLRWSQTELHWPCTGNKALSGHSDSKRKTRQKNTHEPLSTGSWWKALLSSFSGKAQEKQKQTKPVPYLVTFFPYISFLNKHFILHHKKISLF